MGHRLSWLRQRLGLGPTWIVDTRACDVPPSRRPPGLVRDGGGTAEAPEGASLSDLIGDMDRAQVTASLVVLREETDEFLRLAARHPGRLFGLAYYDSLAPREGLERVRALCHDHPALIVGVASAMPRFRQDPRRRDFVPLYAYCGERGLPLQFPEAGDPIGAEADRPMAFAVLAWTHPRLKVVCHAGGSWHGERLALLHRLPNLFLQVDGLSLRTLPRAAGSRKLLFGSDWQGREAGYFQHVEAVRRLPSRRRQQVGWRTAVRVYGPRILCPPAPFDPQPSSR